MILKMRLLEKQIEGKKDQIEKLKKKNKELKSAVTKYREKMRTHNKNKKKLDIRIKHLIDQSYKILNEIYDVPKKRGQVVNGSVVNLFG